MIVCRIYMESISLNVDEIIVTSRKDAMVDSLDEFVELIKNREVIPTVHVVVDSSKYVFIEEAILWRT